MQVDLALVQEVRLAHVTVDDVLAAVLVLDVVLQRMRSREPLRARATRVKRLGRDVRQLVIPARSHENVEEYQNLILVLGYGLNPSITDRCHRDMTTLEQRSFSLEISWSVEDFIADAA